MSDYSLEKWFFGVTWQSIKFWRHVVANIVGKPESAPIVLGPFPHVYPMLSEIVKPIAAVAVVADKPEVVPATTSRTSLTMFRDWLSASVPTNIVSGRSIVSACGVNRTGLTGFRSPSRCRKSGSRFSAKPDYLALAESVGAQAVADVLAIPVSDNRRLELLASMLLTGKAVADVQRMERTRDGIGFADCCPRTIGTMQSHIVPNDEADSVLLRLIARQSAYEDDRLVLAGKIEAVADSLKAGLSIAWKAGLTDEKTAELLQVTDRTVRNYRRKVAEAVSGFGRSLPK